MLKGVEDHTSSLVLGIQYELVPEAGRAAREFLLATLKGVDNRPLVVDRHVVLLGVVLQRQRHRHPRLFVQDRELVPSVVPQKRYH